MQGLGREKGKQKGLRQLQVPLLFMVHTVYILFCVYLSTQVLAIRMVRT